jgi:MFS family permease
VIGSLLLFYSAAILVVDVLTGLILPTPVPFAVQSPAQWFSVWLDSWSWWLLMGPFFLILLLYPTGKLLSPRWRWVEYSLLVCFLIFLFVISFSPELTSIDNPELVYRNPYGWMPLQSTNAIIYPTTILLFLTGGTAIASVFIRYRRGSKVEREQIKWLLFACALFLPLYFVLMFSNLGANSVAGVVFNVVVTGIPIAIGVAILGYHLYDIDIIIRRTLIYATLTILLGAFYTGLVVGFQRLFTSVTGQQSPAALVLSTLAIVTVFNVARLRVQRFVDRRFFRSRYNAEQVLLEFSQTLRDEVDLKLLSERLLTVAQETVEPKTASLWIQEMES